MIVIATPTNKRPVRKLLAYSAAASSLAMLTDSACAAVIPFTPPGAPLEFTRQDTPAVRMPIDINGDAVIDFQISGYFGFSVSMPMLNAVAIAPDPVFSYLAAIVPAGETIGPNLQLLTGFSDIPAGLRRYVGQRGFLGVRFDIPGGSPHYGFLDLEISSDNQILTLYGGAYESEPNTPIVAGVPEPSSLALLAVGAGGLAAWRARRRKTA